MPGVDPRRPNAIKKWDFSSTSEEGSGGVNDYMSLLSLMFGFFGLMFRFKLSAWLALICCFISMANMRSAESDFKQIFSSVLFSTMGIVLNYWIPNRPI